MNKHETLGIIKAARMGNWDGHVGLTMEIKMLEGGFAAFIPYDKAKELVRTVGDIKDLVGEAVVVETDGTVCEFKRIHK